MMKYKDGRKLTMLSSSLSVSDKINEHLAKGTPGHWLVPLASNSLRGWLGVAARWVSAEYPLHSGVAKHSARPRN